MVYITVKQSPKYPQVTMEQMLSGTTEIYDKPINSYLTDTITYEKEFPGQKYLNAINVAQLLDALRDFNNATEKLRECPRESLYREFEIYKKSGGKRRISEPNRHLMAALYDLKSIFEDDFHVLYHTSAFAYVRKRSSLDALRRHQANASKWFAKFDFSDFFGSTTLEFVVRMFSMVFPFSELVKYPIGKEALETALSLAFLRGGLPQGSPLSPLITNVMMIPIDFILTRDFRDFDKHNFVYTRYADDIQISSRYDFNITNVQNHIIEVLNQIGAPFHLKESKTRYGSSSGRNWNLGLMLNKDNKITIGSVKRRRFEAMVSSYVMDAKNGRPWDIGDVRHMEGLRNYYHMVEGDNIDRILDYLGRRFGVDVRSMIKADLSGRTYEETAPAAPIPQAPTTGTVEILSDDEFPW